MIEKLNNCDVEGETMVIELPRRMERGRQLRWAIAI